MHPKWENTLQSLWRKSRFTSYFFQAVHFREDREIPTLSLSMTASRLMLLYHPDFIERHQVDELTGLLVHEMLHILLNHDHRVLPGEDPFLQNMAQDMVVNSYITDHEKTFFSRTGRDIREEPLVILPKGLPRVPQSFFTVSDRKIKDPTWEEVFEWLKIKLQSEKIGVVRDGAADPEPGIPDAGEGSHQDFRKTDILPEGMFFHRTSDGQEGGAFRDHTETFLPTGVHLFQNSRLKASARSVKRRIISFAGRDETCRSERLYQRLAMIIDDIKPVRTHHFYNKLKFFLEQASQSDDWTYSTSRLNRRYFGSGIYAPGRSYQKRKVITVAVDVSGSMMMNPGSIENAFGAIESLQREYKIHLLCIDEDLFVPKKRDHRFISSENPKQPYIYQKGDWRYLRTGTSGATFFKPLFNTYMLRHREPLIVITDGEIFDLNQLTPYAPTLWVLPDRRLEPFSPPFGKVGVIGYKAGA